MTTQAVVALGPEYGGPRWQVTSRELVRAVLADQRFSARQDWMSLPGVEAGSQAPPSPGTFVNMDPPDHTRYRKLLMGEFTVRRMRLLTERIEEITEDALEAMARTGGPVDLITAFARPIPSLVICEILGVPYGERDRFLDAAILVTSANGLSEEVTEAIRVLKDYLEGLVRSKVANPGDDVLSGLTRTDLTEEEMGAMGGVLLGAGVDTTTNLMTLGVFELLKRDGDLSALRTGPGVVEELLRHLSIVPWLLRVAREDVEVGGELIRAGDTVLLGLADANRDPARFEDPDTFDPHRTATGHVAFGHGVHQCLGQQLARVELGVALPALARRFPGLRLAVPAEQVELKPDFGIRGVHALPVTWDD
ncbi:cytochrome P450 [Crossiella equi]|uniref:Cytochrome P450 n=1 Tax=Crossiella equi TaxID=130796 RepID=A0ABS5AII5_9PSEU|nr:cytochrome P450 [Crossiella equi]MBP2476393.1 cytochrome P450 [Crossiella equi]